MKKLIPLTLGLLLAGCTQNPTLDPLMPTFKDSHYEDVVYKGFDRTNNRYVTFFDKAGDRNLDGIMYVSQGDTTRVYNPAIEFQNYEEMWKEILFREDLETIIEFPLDAWE